MLSAGVVVSNAEMSYFGTMMPSIATNSNTFLHAANASVDVIFVDKSAKVIQMLRGRHT